MENDGYDPLGSCFIFDYDPVAAGLDVISDPPTKPLELNDADMVWLKAMGRAM